MLWLYAIFESPQRGGGRGWDGELPDGLRAVHCGDLAVAVEDVDRPRPVRPESLREHDRQVRRLAATVPALLPARFGQTAADDDALARSLGADAARLVRALDHVRDCVQVTVRIHRDGDEPTAGETDPDPAAGPGRQYLRRRLARHRIAGLDELRRQVAPWVRDSRSRWGPKPVLASVYHLVPKHDCGRFRTAACQLVPPPGVRLQVSEPLPAYAFASPASLLAP